MSRYSAYTHWFILLNKREQVAFTLAFVWLATKPNLTMSERRTLAEFERVWFAGKDFTPDRTFDFFIAACRRHRVKIEFMRKPPELGRRGERGMMQMVEWDQPEATGAYWPEPKHRDGTRKSFAEITEEKAKLRTKTKLLEMAKLGVPELTFSHEQIEQMIDRKVEDRVREIEPEVQEPEDARVESNPAPTTNSYTTPRIPFRIITGGKAA